MLNTPVKVISKTITVVSTDNPDRFGVVVYLDGKLDSAHLPMSRDEATALAAAIANGDSPHARVQSFPDGVSRG